MHFTFAVDSLYNLHMSDLLDRIEQAPPAKSSSSRRKGTAPTIRKLKAKYPEMTQVEIAKRVGCSADNVYSVLRRYHRGANTQHLRDFQDNKADILDQLAHRVVMSISDQKLKKMSASQAFVGLGILTDKSQLLKGLPTGINVSVLMDVVEALRNRPAVVAPQVVDEAS